MPVPAPLILAVALPPAVQSRLDALRRRHYPRAIAPAHLSLFRHLPGPQAPALVRDLKRLLAETPPPEIRIEGVLHLEGAVAAGVHSPALDALRLRLADWWAPLLLPADSALPRLHITLAAHLFAPAARTLAAQLAPQLQPARFIARSLLLWQHDAAGWSPLVRLAFRH